MDGIVDWVTAGRRVESSHPTRNLVQPILQHSNCLINSVLKREVGEWGKESMDEFSVVLILGETFD